MRNHGEILQLERKGYRVKIEIEHDLKASLRPDGKSMLKDNDEVALDDMLDSIGRTDLHAALQVSRSPLALSNDTNIEVGSVQETEGAK